MLEFKVPIPIVLKHNGENGYAIYVVNSGALENDVWTVVHCNGGIIRHYRTDQILIHKNETFDIKK